MKSASGPEHSQISRNRYQALFENSLAALFIAKPDGSILEANTAACRMFGYTKEEFRKLKRKDIIDPKISRLDERLEERKVKGKTGGELEGIRKNGEKFTGEFTSSFFEDEDGEKLSSVMIIDVSEKKVVQERMQSITDNIPGVVFRYKLYPDGSDTFLHVSDGSKNVWGLSAEKVIQNNQLVWNLIHKDDIEELKRTIRYSAENLTHWFHEWRIHHPDGQVRWNRGIGKPTRLEDGSTIWDSIVMDITDEKKAKLEMELLINNTEESFILMDKDLNIVSFNQQFKKLYQKYYGIKVQKGDNIIKYSQPERRDRVKKIYENVLAGKTETSEITVPVDDDNVRIISLRFNPARNAESEIIGAFVTALDKTEEIQTRKLLEESNERYKYVTKATSDAIWEFVPETEKLVWGDGFKTLFGYKSNAEKKRQGIDRWLQKIHPEDKPWIEEELEEIWSGSGRTWDQEYRFKKADGTYAFVRDKAIILRDKNGKPERVIGAMQDITERKQEEERLKLLESVVTHANDAVLITKAEPLDAPDGPEIVYVNEAFEKMTGYKSEEVIGKTPRILQGPNTDYEELEKLGEALRKFEPYEMETINYRKNGEEYWTSLSVSPVSDADGTYSHFTAVERDVTGRKNRELQKSLVNDVSRIFNDSPDLKDALQEVTKKLKNFGDFCLSEVWLIDELNQDSSELKLSACYAESEMCKQFYQQTEDIISLKKGIGMPGITLETGKSQFWKDAGENENMVRKKAAKAAGIKTIYGFPIIYNDKTLGCLMLGLDYSIDKQRYYMPLLEKFCIDLGAEIQRKQVEDELSRIFSSAPDIICVAGIDGYFKKVNPAMIDMLGYTEEELLNKPIVEFVHPDDRKKTAKELKSIASGKEDVVLDNRYITKSGNIIWLSWTSRSFYDEGYTFGVAKDVTEQKELEDLLKQANRLSKIGSWEYNFKNKEMYWSDITRQIHEVEPGYTPKIEEGILFYKEGESRNKIKKAVDEAIKNGTPWDLELQIVTAKGNERWIRSIGEAEMVDGECVRIYGSFQDINQRKEAEQAFKEASEERIEILESIDDNFYALDKNFRFTYLNNSAAERLQLQNEEAEGKSLFHYFPELKNTIIYEKLQEATETGEPQKFEFYYPPHQRWFDESIYPNKNGFSFFFKEITEKKNAEKELQKAYEEKNAILESIGDGFFTIDNEFHVTYWNNNAEELLQTPREEILGEYLWDIFEDPVERKAYHEYSKALDEQVKVSFEDYYEPVDRWFEVSAYPSSNGLSVFFKDVTERKKDAEKLSEKTRQLNAIAKFNGLLIKEDDWLDALEKSLPAFGNVVDADRVYYFENHLNETGQKVSSMKLEWTAEGVEPQIDLSEHQAVPFSMMNEFIDPLSENRLFSTTVRTISSDDFRNLLEKQDIKSVLAVPVFTGNTFRGFIGFDDCRNERNWREEEFAFLRTISINLSSTIENEDAEIALQDSFEEKNNILESIGDCFFAVRNDWTVTYWNNMAEKILGLPREKIVGKNLWDLYEDAKELDFYSQYHKAMHDNKTVHFEEYYPGTEMWFEVSAYPSSQGISVFFKDITDRKKNEERLKELNKSLEQHTKELAASNAELEQFAFVASHDLQEPLRMITSFLAQLERKYEPVLDERAKKYIYFATDGAKRMRQIILDLLDYSRVGRINNERSDIDVNQLLEDVVSLHKKIIGEKDAKITWDTLPVIYAAKSPMQQVFQNLIGNALHYHKEGHKPVVEVEYEETDRHWKFFVKDNGIGINPEYKDKIFNIFQRLHGKEEYSGTGVGLAICKKIVEEHGGEIYVESTEGKGSTFYFTIAKKIDDSEST